MAIKRIVGAAVKVGKAARKVKQTGQKALKVAKAVKTGVKTAAKVAKHGARAFGKLSTAKKLAAVAAAPLAPLAYVSTTGFRDPVGGAKALAGAAKSIGRADPVGFVKATGRFQTGMMKKDADRFINYSKKKKKQ